MHIRLRASYSFLLCVLALGACDSETRHHLAQFHGDTMGTTWTVKITDPPVQPDQVALQKELEDELRSINNSMSTYIDDSELSRLNHYRDSKPFPLSNPLYTVLDEALRISQLSGGAFDVTVGPLVNLWGFGPEPRMDHIPDEADIRETLSHTGANKIRLQAQPPAATKLDPDVYIDLSAIAKGYAVDRLADTIERYGIKNYMVEIGGELRLHGINERGKPWTIAVEKPDPMSRSALVLIHPGSAAVATSGDYRNYYEENGIRYSHTINPATGRPITHKLASVTVITERCMTADALATALMVMGPERGLAFAQQHKLAVLFLVKTETGFDSIPTDAFKPYLN